MCSLLQVVATAEDREPPSETPRPPRADGVEDTLFSHISGIAYKLALSEEERQVGLHLYYSVLFAMVLSIHMYMNAIHIM